MKPPARIRIFSVHDLPSVDARKVANLISRLQVFANDLSLANSNFCVSVWCRHQQRSNSCA
jgi:hypothetical protein